MLHAQVGILLIVRPRSACPRHHLLCAFTCPYLRRFAALYHQHPLRSPLSLHYLFFFFDKLFVLFLSCSALTILVRGGNTMIGGGEAFAARCCLCGAQPHP